MAHYFKLAADQEHIDGEVFYGCCLYRGVGVEENIPLARTYFDNAAKKVQWMVFFGIGYVIGRTEFLISKSLLIQIILVECSDMVFVLNSDLEFRKMY
jgi:hypothetical protein